MDRRSAKYKVARAQVDKTKLYDPFAAIELIKKLSYAKFEATLEVHGVAKTEGTSYSLSLPHSTGKKLRVVVASDEVLAQIEAGKIDFDILLSTKEFMPKLTKYARVLGPKGLMPNPKNGSLTADPEKAKAKLEGGAITFKTEKKAPLFHLTIGKVSMDTKKLLENLQAIIKAVGVDLKKISLSASMSPGVKVKLE